MLHDSGNWGATCKQRVLASVAGTASTVHQSLSEATRFPDITSLAGASAYYCAVVVHRKGQGLTVFSVE